MAKIRENTQKETVIAWRNAILQEIEVYLDHQLIGTGYLVTKSNGDISRPKLFDLNGNKLPQGWYTLKMTESKLCIIPKNIQ